MMMHICIFKQVLLAMHWHRPDVLHWLLRKNSQRMQRYDFQTQIDIFLHTAIESHNERAVVKLREYGASLSAYQFTIVGEGGGRGGGGGRDASQIASDASFRVQQKMAQEVQLQHAARLWEGLITASEFDPATRHVYSFLQGIKKKFRARARLRGGKASEVARQEVGRLIDAQNLSALRGWEAFAGLETHNVVSGLSQEQHEDMEDDDFHDLQLRCTILHVHTCVHAHTHTFIHTHIHIHTHTYAHTHVHTNTHTHRCKTWQLSLWRIDGVTYTHINTHAHSHAYTHTHTLSFSLPHTHTHIHTGAKHGSRFYSELMGSQTHTNTHIHTHTHTYTHTHTHTCTCTCTQVQNMAVGGAAAKFLWRIDGGTVPVLFRDFRFSEFRSVPLVCAVSPPGHGHDFLAVVQAADPNGNCGGVHVSQNGNTPQYSTRPLRRGHAEISRFL